MRLWRTAIAVTSLWLISSCNLIDDVFTFDFCSDEQQFTISADQLGLTVPGGTVPQVNCTADSECTTGGVNCSGGTNIGCELKCVSQSCQVEGTFSQAAPVDLTQTVGNKTQATLLSKVTLDRIEYRVTANTLNFDTPVIQLHVGDQNATQVGPGVTQLAEFPVIPAGQTPTGNANANGAGQAALSGFVKNYKVPFKLLTTSTLVFGANDPVPTGSVSLSVKSCFAAEVF